MKPHRPELLSARQDVLCLVLTELAKALPPQEAGRVARGIGHAVAQRLVRESVEDDVDQAIAADLAPILRALQR